MGDSIFKGNKYITPDTVKESLLKDTESQSTSTRILANVAVAGKLALEAEYQNDNIKREYAAIILYVFKRIDILDQDMGDVFSSAVMSFCSTDKVDPSVGLKSIENLQDAYVDMSTYMTSHNIEYGKGLHKLMMEMKGNGVNGGTETAGSED